MVIISMPTTPEGYKTLQLTEEVAVAQENAEYVVLGGHYQPGST